MRSRAPAALLAVVGCAALFACANPSATRRRDADAHYRMATAALQQPGGIQSEVNRRAAYPELTLAIQLDPDNPLAGNSLVVKQSGSFNVCTSVPFGSAASTGYRTSFTPIEGTSTQ